jgi:hypothetical protein
LEVGVELDNVNLQLGIVVRHGCKIFRGNNALEERLDLKIRAV